VYDNLKLPNAKLEAEDGGHLFLEDVKFHSKNEVYNVDSYIFALNYTFDE
jgi:hypothetical protein